MKTYKRVTTLKKAEQLKRCFAAIGARFRELGDRRVTGYNYKLIVYAKCGGNEWCPPHNVEQFTVYYN